MKKTLLTLAAFGLIATLAGCSNAKNTASSASAPAASSETPTSQSTNPADLLGRNTDKAGYLITEEFDKTKEVEITFYSTMSNTTLVPVYDEYIKDFNELYPNIKINHSQPGSYDQVRDQIKTELSANGGPDIAYCYADHVALYNKTKSVVKLDNLISDPVYGLKKSEKQDFIPGYYNEGSQFGDGKMYTLPFSKSTEVLYYNDTFFKANNLTVPTTWFSATYDASGNPTDTTSMEYVCYKCKQIDPDCTPLGYDSDANWFITMCEQMKIPYTSASGDHFLFNNAKAKDLVYKLNQWKAKGYFTTQGIYSTYTSGLFVQTAADQEKSYMSIGSSAGATHQRPTKQDGVYPFNVGIAEIPQYDATNKKVISQGPSLCVFNHGDQQKVLASWLLMKYLTANTEFQAAFSSASGYVPAIKSVNEIKFKEVKKDEKGKDVKDENGNLVWVETSYAEKLAVADGGDNIAFLSANVCLNQVDNYFTSPAFIGSSDARDQVGQLITICSQLSGTEDEIKAQIDTKFATAIQTCEYNS